MENQTSSREEFRVSGEDLVRTVKEIIAAGNARRIIVQNESGKALIEIPLTVGAVAALIAPVLVAVGAIAGMVTKCTLIVEKRDGS